MSNDTIEERFFGTAIELGVDAREGGYKFPLVIEFSDQTNRVACILTMKNFGKLLSRETLEWDCSGWVWEWEPDYLSRVYEEPFRAALTSYDGQRRNATVPLLTISEEAEIMRGNQNPD